MYLIAGVDPVAVAPCFAIKRLPFGWHGIEHFFGWTPLMPSTADGVITIENRTPFSFIAFPDHGAVCRGFREEENRSCRATVSIPEVTIFVVCAGRPIKGRFVTAA